MRRKRRETAEERQFRKEMELLGMMVWMGTEAELITATVKHTGETMRALLLALTGRDDARDEHESNH